MSQTQHAAACRRQLAAQLRGSMTPPPGQQQPGQLVIVSSPFSRTRQTAERVAAVLHLEPAYLQVGGMCACVCVGGGGAGWGAAQPRMTTNSIATVSSHGRNNGNSSLKWHLVVPRCMGQDGAGRG
jgi:hypothetical protein